VFRIGEVETDSVEPIVVHDDRPINAGRPCRKESSCWGWDRRDPRLTRVQGEKIRIPNDGDSVPKAQRTRKGFYALLESAVLYC
jgi:hypothetical protein